jgi:hypothetical protein
VVLLGLVHATDAHGEEEAPSHRDVDTAQWKQIRKALPKYLWLADPAKRRKSKVDATWRERDFGRVRLDRRQFAELGALLRAGSPYTTQKSRSTVLDVRTGAETPDGEDETMPVRVAAGR